MFLEDVETPEDGDQETKQSESHRLNTHKDHALDDDDTQNVGLLIMIGIASFYSFQWTVEQPLDDRIAVILSFSLFMMVEFNRVIVR